jgi:hypothetical protein
MTIVAVEPSQVVEDWQDEPHTNFAFPEVLHR